MSICIASLAEHGSAIVAATDQRLSFAGTAFDHALVKGNFIGFEWFAMWCADDTRPIPAILARTSATLKTAGGHGKEWSADQVSGALSEAYRAETQARAEAEFLRPFGLDMTEFRRSGRRVLGERHGEKVEQISSYGLSVHFLVVGFSGIKSSIFSVAPRGHVTDWTQFGMAAIGSGELVSYLALGASMHSKGRAVQETVYAVLDAKFAAEVADGVGPDTTVIVMRHSGGIHPVPAVVIDKARRAWERRRAKAPPQAVKAIGEWWEPIRARVAEKEASDLKALAANWPTPPVHQASTDGQTAQPPSPASPGASDES